MDVRALPPLREAGVDVKVERIVAIERVDDARDLGRLVEKVRLGGGEGFVGAREK